MNGYTIVQAEDRSQALDLLRGAAWRAVFMSPGDGQFVTLVGRAEGDRIVQEIIDRPPDAAAERWTFSEITDAGFLWQAETSSDGGRRWAVTHEMRASRRLT